MIFYSSVAILIGIFMVIVGIKQFKITEAEFRRTRKKKISDIKKYTKSQGILLLIIAPILIISGIISFIIEWEYMELAFSGFFVLVLVIYFLIDSRITKKFTIKD